MPTAPPKACKCGGVIREGKCARCEGGTHEASRKNSHDRGYNYRWRRDSKVYLDQHPVCVTCGNLAQCVDHVIPHKGDKALFWDVENWQALCKRCHDKKTARGE